MTNFLSSYALFALKAVTIALLIAGPVLILLLVTAGRRRPADSPTIEVQHLNDVLRSQRLALEEAILPPQRYKERMAADKSARKAARKDDAPARPRLFVLEFIGDLRARGATALAQEVTAVLAAAEATDEVAVVLESAGGTVHGYGLAASQLQRIRARGLRLSVLIDKVAASGGYMMACVGNEVVAAPFAIVGSIGVVAQLPNFNRLLRKHDVDFELVTAGKFKRTLTLFGENSAEGRAKFQEEIDDAHALFKAFIAERRPHLDLERVATGEYWFGTRALELGLVDRLATSDEFITDRAARMEVYRVKVVPPRRPWRERLLGAGARMREWLDARA